jgi:hypothetical protein
VTKRKVIETNTAGDDWDATDFALMNGELTAVDVLGLREEVTVQRIEDGIANKNRDVEALLRIIRKRFRRRSK